MSVRRRSEQHALGETGGGTGIEGDLVVKWRMEKWRDELCCVLLFPAGVVQGVTGRSIRRN